MSRFRSVVLDVDSTLSGIEGIDWLAARRGPAEAEASRTLTARAMAGEIPIERIYAERMDRVRPTAADLAALATAYQAAVAPGARDTVGRFLAAGIEVHAVSGGIREAILPFAQWLGLGPAQVHAVRLRTDDRGGYAGWDESSPLATSAGKPLVVRALALPGPLLAVGDGTTDLALRSVGATFAAFTGFARRESVIRGADHVIATFDELRTLVLP